jgi:tetratricopeptide (TPR) repeat protein
MGAPDESERRHRRAVALVPNSVGPRLGLAAALMAQGDLDGALAEYSGALLLDGHNATALAGSGSVHFQREQWANAESNYRAALDAHPEAHWAMDGLARTCLARGGDAQEALELAKAAYALAATPRYLETAAFAYVAMSDRESARIAATTAVRMDPENPSYRATLRRINEMRGNE